VDIEAVRARNRNTVPMVEGDVFLPNLGLEKYMSVSQRNSIRAALTTPPGSTSLVILPTGEGKSLTYLSVAKFGYEGSPGPDAVNLVVVPTIALAVDQKQAAIQYGLADRPRAFLGGDPHGTNNQIIEAIKDGTQGLLFAAPESVVGRLREPLEQSAKAGFLKVIVIDEAHLIDAWGALFRPEYQVLPGLRRSLIAESPQGKEPRTLLLSATVTQSALENMKALFGNDDGHGLKSSKEFQIISGARLRPEIEYWASTPCHQEVQSQRIEEALRHLPRPAIVYTSSVLDANNWFDHVREMGFQRVACMTGDTSSSERAKIVRGWRSGEIDLVVGTSAFGLGIDNPHVRTVIHACIPESLDRFYQEVGRGGRDGRTSISVVIPNHDDQAFAKRLHSSHITVDVGFNRWISMYKSAEPIGDRLYRLQVDLPPGDGPGRMDMVGDTNTDWNIRTLTMLANAGLIELRDVEIKRLNDEEHSSEEVESKYVQYQTVYVNNTAVSQKDTWLEKIEPFRTKHRGILDKGLSLMNEAVAGDKCVANVLFDTYRISDISGGYRSEIVPARACGGCQKCRQDNRLVYSRLPVPSKFSWDYDYIDDGRFADLLDANNRAVVFIPEIGKLSRTVKRRFRQKLASYIQKGFRSWVIEGEAPIELESIADDLIWPVIFASSWADAEFLPPGPRISVVHKDSLTSMDMLEADSNGFPQLFVLHEDTIHPEREDRLLKGNIPITWSSLDDFVKGGGIDERNHRPWQHPE